MIFQHVRLLMLYSVLQVGTIILSLFVFLFSISLIILILTIIPFFESLLNVLPDQSFFLLALAIMAFIYGNLWYYIFKETKKQEINRKLALVYLLIPNLLFTVLSLPSMFELQDPYSCGFIPPRVIFFCFAFSLFLLPLFWLGLEKWVCKNQSLAKEYKRLLMLFLGLGVLCFVVLGIMYIRVDDPRTFFTGVDYY